MNDNFIKKQLINIIEKSDFTELHLSVESENEIILKKFKTFLSFMTIMILCALKKQLIFLKVMDLIVVIVMILDNNIKNSVG